MYTSIAPGPNYCNSRIPVQSELKIQNWYTYKQIIDKIDPTLLVQLECGFTMGIDTSIEINIPVTNHLSARKEYSVIDDFVVKHYESGAILGPYFTNPFPVNAKPSPMQVATSASGKKRPVLDMSYPTGKSINNAIPQNWSDIQGFDGEFRLPTHDKICNAIVSTPEPRMFITDMKHYYMQIPSDWADTPLMCFTWRGALWLHRRLPFGARSSCLHAQRVTDVITAIFTSQSKQHMDGYVDDCASIVTLIISHQAYAFFHWLLDYLGVARSVDKDQCPDLLRVFLGLLYNLSDMVMTIPEDKLHRALKLLNDWLLKETCTKAQVQSLLGHLNHFSAVVHAGRPFTARIVDLLREEEFPAPVPSDLKQDISMWIEFMQNDFSRSSIIKSQDLTPPDNTLRLAINGQTFVIEVQGKTFPFVLNSDMPHFPPHAMFAIAAWKASMDHAAEFAGLVVKVTVPTKAAALVINRAKTQVDSLRVLIREMWCQQAKYDFVIKACVQSNNNKCELYAEFHDFQPINIPL